MTIHKGGQPPPLFPDDDGQPGKELVVRDEQELDVLEGVVVEPRLLHIRQAAALARTVATHQHTKTAARHAIYIAVGGHVAWRRIWDARTTSPYEREIRAAQAAGDREHALKALELREAFLKGRHQRRMDWIDAPVKVARGLIYVIPGGFALLILLGIFLAVGRRDVREVVTPILTIADAVTFLVNTADITVSVLAYTGPAIAAGALYALGRGHASSVGWAQALQPDNPDAGIIVTADTIVLALQHLKIPELKAAFKTGWVPTFSLLPIREGNGYHAVCSLPLGVTAEMVADQRPVLARNLHRAQIETWPSDAEAVGTGTAGELDLWIADRGALAGLAPEYPLLHEGTADVFTGVPVGVSPRGDQITAPIVANNFVAGGQMGQGKSNACRVLLLGCALDPLCIIDAYVFANNGDFDAFRPRLANYHKGTEDETVMAALDRLRWLYGEVGRREGRLAELGAKKVTRALAEKHPDLRPIVSLYSECHELFGHPEHGEEASELAVKTMKRARKTAIVLGFDTQSSRKKAIPPELVENVSVNVCFYVKSWRNNDGFLGDGCFAAGIRATELRPGRDRGTSLIVGVSDNAFDLLKWYYIEVDDDAGYDAATEVIARALANMAPGTPADAVVEPREIEVRDLLDDLDEVLGHDKVRLADVPALLRDLAPTWGPYRTLKGTDLRDELEAASVRLTNTGNVLRLDPKDLRKTLAERGELGGSEHPGTSFSVPSAGRT